jgi:hypothetical protein
MDYHQYAAYKQRYRHWAHDKKRREEARKSSKNTKIFAALFLLALAAYLLSTSNVTKSAKEQFRKEKIVVVKGTVLSADLVIEPTSGAANVGEVVVAYEQSPGNTMTKTFYLEHDMIPDTIPKMGDMVLVSWNKDHPDNAYLMPIDYRKMD